MAKQDGTIADIKHDDVQNAGMTTLPKGTDQIGSTPENTVYADSVKNKKQTTPPLGGDVCDVAAASDGNSDKHA